MKKRKFKGFTLIELIIVMAIFSLLMVGAMSLIDPISKIHSRANTGENSYAYVDNIQNYLQDSLEYSDHLWVVQGDFTQDELSEKAFEFKKTYYNDVIAKKDKDSTTDFGNCKIRVMSLLNKDTEDYKKGQILMQTVEYQSDYGSAADSTDAAYPLSSITASNVAQLNEAAFSDTYLYDYIIGAGNLVKSDSNHLVVDSIMNDAKDVAESLTPANFAVTIVAYSTKTDRNGQVTRELDVSNGTETLTINEYPTATHYTIANIPLFNIIQRNGQANNSYWIRGLDDGGNETWASARHNNVAASPFVADASEISMKKDDNIYIIYAMADEIAVPQ